MPRLHIAKVNELPGTLSGSVLYLINESGQLKMAMRDPTDVSRVAFSHRDVHLSGPRRIQKHNAAIPRQYRYRIVNPNPEKIDFGNTSHDYEISLSAGSFTVAMDQNFQLGPWFEILITPPSTEQNINFKVDGETSVIEITDTQVQSPVLSVVSGHVSGDTYQYPIGLEVAPLVINEGDTRHIQTELYLFSDNAGSPGSVLETQTFTGNNVASFQCTEQTVTVGQTVHLGARCFTTSGYSDLSNTIRVEIV